MMNTVYLNNARYARDHGELNEFIESGKKNDEAVKAIEKIVADNFDGYRLNKKAVREAVEACGEERLNLILVNTVQDRDWDGRIGADVKRWAKLLNLPDCFKNNTSWMLHRIHSAVLDGFTRGWMNYNE